MSLLQPEDGPRDPDKPLERDEFIRWEGRTGNIKLQWVGGGVHPVGLLLSVERLDGGSASVVIHTADLIELTNELRLAGFAAVAPHLPDTIVANFIRANADIETAIQARAK